MGMSMAGIGTAAFCELSSFRRAVLERTFPGVPVHDDVRTYAGVAADILVGGPPCQRTSVASAIHGKRTGESLWREMLRIAIDHRHQWVVVEQPPGNAAWEAQVEGDLAGAGYHTARAEFAAADLGAPHIRRRMFILAHPCLSRLAIAWQAVPREIERIARGTVAGNHWASGVPGALRVVDRPPYRPDRRDRIEAIGDSNPPAMMAVIGRAILAAESEAA